MGNKDPTRLKGSREDSDHNAQMLEKNVTEERTNTEIHTSSLNRDASYTICTNRLSIFIPSFNTVCLSVSEKIHSQKNVETEKNKMTE